MVRVREFCEFTTASRNPADASERERELQAEQDAMRVLRFFPVWGEGAVMVRVILYDERRKKTVRA